MFLSCTSFHSCLVETPDLTACDCHCVCPCFTGNSGHKKMLTGVWLMEAMQDVKEGQQPTVCTGFREWVFSEKVSSVLLRSEEDSEGISIPQGVAQILVLAYVNDTRATPVAICFCGLV